MPDSLSSPLRSSPLSATSASGAPQLASLPHPTMITEILCTYTMRNFRDNWPPARAGERGGDKWRAWGEVGTAAPRRRHGLFHHFAPPEMTCRFVGTLEPEWRTG